MGIYDKDRYQKELALRYCLARDTVPFLEVKVSNVADLSDTVQELTDLDVLGIEAIADGSIRRTIFDCKTANKMSPINRVFWAAGVKEYTKCNEAFVLFKNKAVHNHRISALKMSVDLHDDDSFVNLGQTLDVAFPADNCYQAGISRWSSVVECYLKNKWADGLYDLARNIVPLSNEPWNTFRKILHELRALKGHFNPAKNEHVVIFFDILASCFVLWSAMGRDIRRFYEPAMKKEEFETILKYYIWGGKETYQIRQQLKDIAAAKNGNAMELPAWDLLVKFVGLIISAPQSILECAHVCRELSIRTAAGKNDEFDKRIAERHKASTRIRQYSLGLNDYLVDGGKLPKDFGKVVQGIMFEG
jgi:hypothetical protein